MENRLDLDASRLRRMVRRWPRDVVIAVALTVAALTLLGVSLVGDRSDAPQPVASTADVSRK